MTEAEWLPHSRTRAAPLLEYLGGKPGDRKLRLFGVACCRRMGEMIGDGRGHHALAASEQYADGITTEEVLHEATRTTEDAILSIGQEVWRSPHNSTYSRAHAAFLSRTGDGVVGDLHGDMVRRAGLAS